MLTLLSSHRPPLGEPSVCPSKLATPPNPHLAATGCGNGIAGIRSEDGTGDVCCLEECGVCGGSGCGSAAGPGFDTSHCCVSVILAAGATCSETGAAPCVIDDGEVSSVEALFRLPKLVLHVWQGFTSRCIACGILRSIRFGGSNCVFLLCARYI